jgi:hypothetical protein
VVPDFVVVGESKAGTTSIYRWLARHPQVGMPTVKDTYFFNDEATPARIAAYEELFAHCRGARVFGDVTPSYLDDVEAPRRMCARNPRAKLIVSLREPVSRLYSAALMNVRTGRAADPIEETRRLAGEARFRVAPSIGELLRYFPRGQVLALRFDDLVADPIGTAASLFSFIGVDPSVEVSAAPAHNPGGLPRSERVHRILEWQPLRRLRRFTPAWAFDLLDSARRANLHPVDALDDALARQLRSSFRDDVRRTAALLDLDLSAWLDRDRGLHAVGPSRRLRPPARQRARSSSSFS